MSHIVPVEPSVVNFILENCQGDVVLGHSKDKELFYFFTIADPAKFKQCLPKLDVTNGEAILKIKADITKCQKGTRVKAPGLNIAFSSKGLITLGFTAEDLQNLDDPDQPFFTKGQLASASALGDRSVNGELCWEKAFKDIEKPIHGVLLITGESWPTVNECFAKAQADLEGSIREVYSLKGTTRPGDQRGHEHFGWLDDISNPAIKGVGTDGKGNVLPGQPQVRPGILLCGMDGDNVDSSARLGWAKGGSFLVIRQLEQSVPEFHEYLSNTSATLLNDPSPEGAHKLGAHLVGRWKSGAPLQITPLHDDAKLGKDKDRNNKFDFSQAGGDDGQALCPFSAHIRKTNPRGDTSPEDAERRSIRRAGITYGPELSHSEKTDKVTEYERGLAFACYQSNIADGFDFMQRLWSNNPGFPFKDAQPGLDPIIGQNSGEDRNRETWGTTNGAKITAMPEFVHSRGGEYFFSPPISALKTDIPQK